MADQTSEQERSPRAPQAAGRHGGHAPKRVAHRQALVGVVVSDKMDKTVMVEVERTVMHRLYRRYLKRRKKFAAHDEANECRVGDRVIVVSTRPLSKRKRWRVREIVARAK